MISDFAVNIILVFTAVTTALMAGLFYSYSCSVIPGLGRLPDYEYIAAMQSINDSIQNAVFFISFFGAPVSLLASVFLHYGEHTSVRFLFLLCAAVIYLVGVFGVTVIGNIPLNKALERFELKKASQEEIKTQRLKFEKKWNNFNTIRTVSSVIALIFVITACLCDRC